MTAELLVPVVLTIVGAATPLLFAALGELVVERSGVLNLGVEGMMIVGAVAAFAVAYGSGSATLGALAGAGAGAGLALIFAFLALDLTTNQVATGLALTIFGLGLSALAGQSFVGVPIPPLPALHIPGLSELPLIGPLVFGHDALVYLSLAATAGVAWFLNATRAGMILRAVGDNHASAHAIGHDVIAVRRRAILFGGAMAGLGGAYLTLVATPMWSEGMTAGRGWIALALVVFASWRPWRALAGAYLFGGVTILQLHAQSFGLGEVAGFAIPAQVLSMLPYLATILVLVAISASGARGRAPASLGKPFRADS